MKKRKKRRVDLVDYSGKQFTKCWTCKNATGDCTWSHFGEPIEGWNAKKTYLPSNGEYAESYFIIDCPEYERG